MAGGGFLNLGRRLAGVPLSGLSKIANPVTGLRQRNFSLGMLGGEDEPPPNPLQLGIASGIAAAATPNIAGGGPVDFFRSLGAGMDQATKIKTQYAVQHAQKRQEENAEIEVQAKLQNAGRPVHGGLVEEDQLMPSVPGSFVPEGTTVKVSRKADPSRVVKYKMRDGRVLEYELYTPDEQMETARQQEVAKHRALLPYKAQEAAAVALGQGQAKQALADADLGKRGIKVPNDWGLGDDVTVLPEQWGGIARSHAELLKQTQQTGKKLHTVENSTDEQGNVWQTPWFADGTHGNPFMLADAGKGVKPDVWSPERMAQEERLIKARAKAAAGARASAFTAQDIDAYVTGLERGEHSVAQVPSVIRDRVLGEAHKRNIAIVSDKEREEIAKSKKMQPVLDAVSELSEKINTGRGAAAKIRGEAEKLKAQANLNDDVAEYEALVSGFTPLVARAVGHTGVLTQQDVDSVKSLFPKPGDSKSLRDRKIKRLMSIVQSVQTAVEAGATQPINREGQAGDLSDMAQFEEQ
jgi:hypothetical protein